MGTVSWAYIIGYWAGALTVNALIGLLIGLVPFFIGKYVNKPSMAKLSLLCCCLTALLSQFLSLLIAVVMILAIIFRRGDINIRSSLRVNEHIQPTVPVYSDQNSFPNRGSALAVRCLSGPLRGQIYRISNQGITFGRTNDCAIRLPDGMPGISGRHCRIQFRQGTPVLVDLGSSYGTFLADGKKLPPNYPEPVSAGTRFYLANTNAMFEIII